MAPGQTSEDPLPWDSQTRQPEAMSGREQFCWTFLRRLAGSENSTDKDEQRKSIPIVLKASMHLGAFTEKGDSEEQYVCEDLTRRRGVG